MRVISGKFKGRQLVSFKADHIRPTTDRVKESLFNILMQDIDGARVLDLFAGTGSLSIEAYSRGAAYVECVESHSKSLKIIFENLRLLKIENEIKVVKSDVFNFIKKYNGDPFDVILVDPPFTEKFSHSVLQELAKSKLFKPGTVIAIESAKKEHMEDLYDSLRLIDRRPFGDKILSLFTSND